VPQYAREVAVYQDTGGAAGPWRVWAGDPALPGISLGQIAHMPPDVRQTEPRTVLPRATHVQTDVDEANDRFFAITWRIRP
jgi:hypothetical protein